MMISNLLRGLPAFKGKQRLSRLFLSRLINSGREISANGKYKCLYVLPNAKETIGFEILINGIYEEKAIDFIAGHLKSGQVFLDIGANIGAITVPVCKRRPDVKAICLEAAPWIFSYLEQNIRNNKLNQVSLINKAISDEGNKEVSFFSPHDKFGKGSLAPVFTSEGVEVETVTLDELAHSFSDQGKIGLIKIDVEGFESLAFKGGAALLGHQDSPDILFEFVYWAEQLALDGNIGRAQKLLMDYGYGVFLFDEGRIGRRIVEPLTEGSCMLFASKRVGSI